MAHIFEPDRKTNETFSCNFIVVECDAIFDTVATTKIPHTRFFSWPSKKKRRKWLDDDTNLIFLAEVKNITMSTDEGVTRVPFENDDDSH